MPHMRPFRSLVGLLLMLLSHTAFAQQTLWTIFNTSNSDIAGNNILALTTDAKGNKWVGTNLGLCRLTGRTWTDYTMFNKKLKDQFINCLTTDKEGNLWLGTDDYGVMKFDGVHWTEYTAETKRYGMKFIREITIDRQGTLWIGVTLGGLLSFDGTHWQKYTQQSSSLVSDFIHCVTIDKRGRKWIGTNEGISLLNGEQWSTFTTTNSSLPHNNVPSIVEAADGSFWMGTLGGLAHYDGSRWTTYTVDNSPLPSDQVNDLAIDEGGLLWIATAKGVASFDGHKHWQTFTPANSPIPQASVNCIAIDAQGSKWFGTDSRGLVRFSGQSIAGTVRDERGTPIEGITLSIGNATVTTDKEGRYTAHLPVGSTFVARPVSEGRSATPESRQYSSLSRSLLNEDYTLSSGMEAQGRSTEKITVNPFLSQGYITISMESEVAEVEFVGSDGRSVRTLPQYRNGQRITISKMPKDSYTLHIRTNKGEKTLRFNLK